MRFRASAIGGKLSIRRAVSGGNAVVCSVPTKSQLRRNGLMRMLPYSGRARSSY